MLEAANPKTVSAFFRRDDFRLKNPNLRLFCLLTPFPEAHNLSASQDINHSFRYSKNALLTHPTQIHFQLPLILLYIHHYTHQQLMYKVSAPTSNGSNTIKYNIAVASCS